jgi:hypothetical protein
MAWIVVAALAATILASCSAHVPAVQVDDSAPSDLVIGTYLQALVQGDCDTARALSTPEFAEDAWCFAPRVTAFWHLGLGYERDDEAGYSAEVDIALGLGSISDGVHTRFYQLHRDPGGPWRVSGVGSGP